jgi:glycosyltransferase involved in cell wall biosynthesis
MPESNPARKPKIGIILVAGASEGSGGTGRRFSRIFEHFQRTESASDVWLITNPGFVELMASASICIDPAINVIEFPGELIAWTGSPAFKLNFYNEYSTRLYTVLEREQFDLVHVPMPHLAYSAFLLRKNDRLRQVFSMTAPVGGYERMNWKAQLLYKIGFVSSEAIDTLNQSCAEYFSAYSDKFRVSPCSFTDYSRYKPAEEKRNFIVYAGRLETEKNPLLFVDAVALCADHLRRNEWKCFLKGSGLLEERVAARVDELAIGDLIELGSVPDLSPLLAESKIFVSLQQTENYPSQVLLEAMAAENAVIATDVGETRKLVDEDVGLLLAEQTPEQMASAITQMTQNPEGLRGLGRNARERAVGGHNVEAFAAYLEKVWLEVLQQNAYHKRPSVMSLVRVILGTMREEAVRRVTAR